jgi:hypothetical protein
VKKTVPPEILLLVFGIIALAVIPPLVGFLVLKLYRHYKPNEQDFNRLTEGMPSKTKDGFFKIFLLGWLICGGPVAYLAYLFMSADIY